MNAYFALMNSKRCNSPPFLLVVSSGSTCTVALDLGVAVDLSTSIRKMNLPSLRDALHSLVNISDISSNGTHMGLILFGKNAELRFNFADAKFHNPAAVHEEIKSKVNTLTRGTLTYKAMVLAKKRLFTTAGGDRPNKRNVLIVLTDGNPSGTPDFTQVTGELKVSQ